MDHLIILSIHLTILNIFIQKLNSLYLLTKFFHYNLKMLLLIKSIRQILSIIKK